MGGRLICLLGPSGSGKDSPIDVARDSRACFDCVVARRVMARATDVCGESAVSVTSQESAAREGFARSSVQRYLAASDPARQLAQPPGCCSSALAYT